jgi:hypothetical protein
MLYILQPVIERITAMFSQHVPSPYKYPHLPEGDFFRYLVLHPGAQDEPLKCSLVVSPLGESTAQFEAISYVWGSNIKNHEIICDGHTLHITANLYEVLKTFRLRNEPRNLWADSICIDQENMEEKGSQVAAMGSIFHSAVRVLIHISGDDTGFAESVASLSKDVCAWIDSVIPTLGNPIPWDSFPECELDDPLTEDERWRGVGMLLAQPWFRRGWVIALYVVYHTLLILY